MAVRTVPILSTVLVDVCGPWNVIALGNYMFYEVLNYESHFVSTLQARI